jgi:hypothetical protein
MKSDRNKNDRNILLSSDDHTDIIVLFYGAVVHSGERRVCIAKVRGSNPLGSTKSINSQTATLLLVSYLAGTVSVF